jgi:hypothetical protein
MRYMPRPSHSSRFYHPNNFHHITIIIIISSNNRLSAIQLVPSFPPYCPLLALYSISSACQYDRLTGKCVSLTAVELRL